jgi:hypothetical protein
LRATSAPTRSPAARYSSNRARIAALAGDVGRPEPPERQQLVLVGLDAQHALLAAADAVELGLGAQVERLEVESGVRVRCHVLILSRTVSLGCPRVAT